MFLNKTFRNTQLAINSISALKNKQIDDKTTDSATATYKTSIFFNIYLGKFAILESIYFYYSARSVKMN